MPQLSHINCVSFSTPSSPIIVIYGPATSILILQTSPLFGINRDADTCRDEPGKAEKEKSDFILIWPGIIFVSMFICSVIDHFSCRIIWLYLKYMYRICYHVEC